MFGHDNQNNRDEEVVQADDHAKVDASAAAAASSDDDHDTGSHKAVPTDTPSIGSFEATPAPIGSHHAATTATTTVPHGSDDLLNIKQEALQALTPLVGQLDQTPEEQFRTTMMMIQASDNHSLVKVAYEAAKKISNEKERAQALLDIVNEINYFTQNSSQA